MFRALSRRVMLFFAIAVIAMCTLLGTIATWAAFSIVGAGYAQAIGTAARDLPGVANRAIVAAGSFDRARPTIEQHFAGSGAVVRFRENGQGPRTPLRPQNQRRPPEFDRGRALGAMLVLSISGIHPTNVTVGGHRAVIFPDLERMNATAASFLKAMGLFMLIVIGITLLLAGVLARAAMKPLIDVTLGLQRLASGEFTRHWIDTKKHNPLGELATAYNGAVDQVTAAIEERLQTETEMRQFIADAGHELRTPLTVVTGYIEVLRKGAALDAPLATRIYDSMTSESRRMRILIDKLILLARLERKETHEPVPLHLTSFLRGVIDAVSPLGSGVDFIDRTREDAIVLADESELHAAVANLIENGLKYAAGAPVMVELQTDAQTASIVVHDRGPGMPAEVLAHAFERFYRGESQSAPGSGLGLAIAKRATERAHGTIELKSEQGNGLRATIRLPRGAPTRSASVSESRQSA